MRSIVRFFKWLSNVLVSGFKAVASLPGMILSSLGGLAAFVSTLFGRFTWLSQATNAVNNATSRVQSFFQGDHGLLGSLLLGWFSLGTLVQSVIFLLSVTVGATVVVLVTLTVAFVSLASGVIVARYVMKGIRVATGGVVKP